MHIPSSSTFRATGDNAAECIGSSFNPVADAPPDGLGRIAPSPPQPFCPPSPETAGLFESSSSPLGSPASSAMSPISNSFFFTPTCSEGSGGFASPANALPPYSPVTASIKPADLSTPPSPFDFPGELIGFHQQSESLHALEGGSPSHAGTSFGKQSPQQPSESPLLFQPGPLLHCFQPAVHHRTAIAGLFLGTLKAAVLPPHTESMPYPLNSFTAIKDAAAAEVIAQIQALGDEAIRSFVALHDSQAAFKSNQSQQALETSYNALIDSRNAIEMRRGVTLVDIGFCLSQLTDLLIGYDNDAATMASIDEEIGFIEKEDLERGLGINFVALDRHRSTFSPYGPSVSQIYRLLFLKFDILIEAVGRGLQAAGSLFIKDPSSLQENRLVEFFTQSS